MTFKIEFGERGGIRSLLDLFGKHNNGLIFSALCTFAIAPPNRYLMVDALPKLVEVLNGDTTEFESCVASVFDDLSSEAGIATKIASLLPSLNPIERLAALGETPTTASNTLQKLGKEFLPPPSKDADLAETFAARLSHDRRSGIEDICDFMRNVTAGLPMTLFQDSMVARGAIPLILSAIEDGDETTRALDALSFLCRCNWTAKRVFREQGGVDVVAAAFNAYPKHTLVLLGNVCHEEMVNRRLVVDDAGLVPHLLALFHQFDSDVTRLLHELAQHPLNKFNLGCFILPLLRLSESRDEKVLQTIDLLSKANDSHLVAAKKLIKDETAAKRAANAATAKAAAAKRAEEAEARRAANAAEVEEARRKIEADTRALLHTQQRAAESRAAQQAAERAEKEKEEAEARRAAAQRRKRAEARRVEEEEARKQERRAAEAAAAKEKAAAAKAAKKQEKAKKKALKSAPSAFAKEAERAEKAAAEARDAQTKAAALAEKAERAAEERAARAAERAAAERAAAEREAERAATERAQAERAACPPSREF